MGGWRYPPQKELKTFPGPIKSFIVKKNHTVIAVSEILRYRQKKLITLYNRIKHVVTYILIFNLFNF